MRTFTAIVMIACLGFVFANAGQPPQGEPKKKDVPAGKAVSGLQLSLTADTSEIIFKDGKIGTPAALRLTFTNVSDKPIKFNAFDFHFSRIKGDVNAMPTDSMTRALVAADRKPFFPKAGDFPEIKPGESWSYGKVAFPGSIPQSGSTFAFCTVVKQGAFHIKFTYNSPKIDDPLAKDAWVGELTSNEVAITAK